MSSIIYKYRINCQTDGYVYTWDETEPTKCPIDTSHTITTSDTAVIEIRDPEVVTIKEETTKTNGIYKSKGYCIPIPSGNVGNVTIESVKYKLPINLMNAWFFANEAHKSDEITVKIAANTIIGSITGNIPSGESIIPVSQSVFDNSYTGYDIGLYNGISSEHLGMLMSHDSVNGNITVENPTSLTWNTSPLTTYVRMTPILIDHCIINSEGKYMFAEKKIGGKYFPENTPIEVNYTNNTGNAKNFVFTLEFLY